MWYLVWGIDQRKEKLEMSLWISPSVSSSDKRNVGRKCLWRVWKGKYWRLRNNQIMCYVWASWTQIPVGMETKTCTELNIWSRTPRAILGLGFIHISHKKGWHSLGNRGRTTWKGIEKSISSPLWYKKSLSNKSIINFVALIWLSSHSLPPYPEC